ncbi:MULTISPECIES: molybdate ABC transporter substrate-binding protein [Geobacter]|uniref:molybdate ABC transporter substrate-binding protein n=1 Tax=Geobacter TaxID=28231 RepID=UPI0025748110|nr:molybdate ABC transporter substrate-binding protein [Geobacter sulfurreducens]BEH11490.1 molybdate ABC transporter substrate-binding protein [Geobacter sulfurreducens subsp. ethanolicus]BET59346.1 molybdate ABC transporter substrate-binding protein [Geobacter sp. 60473]HML76794.1 molybdate ABC transporter substrate-binding protein [Geobacter sulfurreducens]
MRTVMKTLSLAFCCILLLATAVPAAELSLSVAASLKEVINELTAEYGKKKPGTTFLKNYGASGALAKQIEQGAPADLFISANREWVDYLQNRKLIDEASRCAFAYNSLVFAGTTKQPVAGMKDLAKLGKIAIGSPGSVPAGEYAVESFKAAGIDKALEGKLVMAKDVREAMKYAELAEVDGAFVYRTDALLLGKQARILFAVPEGLHDRVTYPMALTTSGAGKKEAVEFLRFLQSAEARKVLEKYGFAVK